MITISVNSSTYPNLMKEMIKPPKVLHCDGDIGLLNSDCVAIVGSRHATEQAKEVAFDLAAFFAYHGYTIVSGLARGIDTAVHDGALEAGGKTIAVLGTSLRKYYPPENKGLQQCIAREGLLVTEYEEDVFNPSHFRDRDTLQAALSLAVIAVQAGRDSGTLHSLRAAYELHRLRFFEDSEIAAAPEKYAGFYQLAKDGIHVTRFRGREVESLVLSMIDYARDNHV